MDGFNEQYQQLQELDASVVAASTDTLEKASEIANNVAFPVGWGVSRELADGLGSWWEDRRGLIQPSAFVLKADSQVLSATYSTGPVGRLEAVDAVNFLKFQEKQRLATQGA